jgi:hypothetical protein
MPGHSRCHEACPGPRVAAPSDGHHRPGSEPANQVGGGTTVGRVVNEHRRVVNIRRTVGQVDRVEAKTPPTLMGETGDKRGLEVDCPDELNLQPRHRHTIPCQQNCDCYRPHSGGALIAICGADSATAWRW